MHIIPLLSSSSCLTDYPSIPTFFFFKWTEFLTTQVGGREAGGLTRFYTGLMSSEPQTACSQPGKKRGPQSGFNPPHDWNREVIFHMCTAVTVPELDSRYPFFFHLSLNLWKRIDGKYYCCISVTIQYIGGSSVCLGKCSFAAVSAGFSPSSTASREG